ncbi:hypothetical protein SLEP1_g28368 [Rubroshorea leprosula]|uniref:Uncharacterized protein n=1 Tax=Rubroshorea leprosula TaxID=152421 RepID=A0AAV5JZ39_9ROSI|nr:hypothetical protein SLEP1_g28368 [Rubroshorea leprosula]
MARTTLHAAHATGERNDFVERMSEPLAVTDEHDITALTLPLLLRLTTRQLPDFWWIKRQDSHHLL